VVLETRTTDTGTTTGATTATTGATSRDRLILETGATNDRYWSHERQILETGDDTGATRQNDKTNTGAMNGNRYRRLEPRTTGDTGAMNDRRYRSHGSSDDNRYWLEPQAIDRYWRQEP